jgi:hypothetical protein
VDHARTVHRRERVGDAPGQAVQRVAVQRPLLGDQLVQPLARDEAGDQVGGVGVDVGVQHLDQVRAAHPAQRVELLPEPPPRVAVGHRVAQHLHRDGPLVGGDAEEDRPHAALAEAAEQAVRADDRRVARAQRCDGHRASPGCRLEDRG